MTPAYGWKGWLAHNGNNLAWIAIMIATVTLVGLYVR
jgi:hypothetical protein